MSRYLQKWRLASLAGLLSLAVFALSAAPAAATKTCPAGVTNPRYCTHKLSMSVSVNVTRTRNGFAITVKIKVADPFVKVTLLRKGKVVKRLLNRNITGPVKLRYTIPKRKKGTYVLKVVASTQGVTKTVQKKFTVGPKPKKKKKK